VTGEGVLMQACCRDVRLRLRCRTLDLAARLVAGRIAPSVESWRRRNGPPPPRRYRPDVPTPEPLRSGAGTYLNGHNARDPIASPLFAADVSWLPPPSSQGGGPALLRSDSERLAARLDEAGVDVQLSIWPSLFHAWARFVRGFPEARRAVDEAAQVFRPLSHGAV